jgi:hypothetical protein
VARNAVYDFYRSRKPTQELDEIPSPTPDPTEDEMAARLSESVREMLDGLSPDQKTALYLTEYEGMTQRDLALSSASASPGRSPGCSAPEPSSRRSSSIAATSNWTVGAR